MKLNLLYIHTHDTGRYLQPYGYAAPTPRLQALAEESTLFRNNYCCGPTCSPSRSAMLTGMTPHQCGMLGLAHRGFRLKDYRQHLAQFLGRNGYDTMLCGMQHEAPDPAMIGYGRVATADKADFPNATGWDMANGESAIRFLQEKHERPFFLSYGLEHTHRPFTEFDKDIRQEYLRVPEPLPDTAETRRDMAGFLTSARRADACFGLVLDELERLGLLESTVILYTTDHGIAFPMMKCNLYDSGIGTALMLRYPGNPSAGQAKDALTSHLDVFPTLCDLLELEKPDWLQGNSLLPLLENRAGEVNEAVFAEVTYHASYEPQRAVRTARYKYIVHCNPDHATPALSNIDDGPSKDVVLAAGYGNLPVDREQLFDLWLDPVERNNLMGQVDYQPVYQELKALLERHMRETGDPLLAGPVPLPAGAIANKFSCLTAESQDPSDYDTM